jgi:hypothetical protein
VKEELKIIKMDDNDKQIMRNVNILLCKTFLEIRFLWLKKYKRKIRGKTIPNISVSLIGPIVIEKERA